MRIVLADGATAPPRMPADVEVVPLRSSAVLDRAAEGRLGADVVLVDATEGNPFPFVQRLHALDGDVEVVLGAPPAVAADLEARLRITPLVRPHVHVKAGAPSAPELDALARRARQRRRHRRLVERLGETLATSRPDPRREALVLDRILEHAPVGVVILDEFGGVRASNRLAATLIGERLAAGASFRALLRFERAPPALDPAAPPERFRAWSGPTALEGVAAPLWTTHTREWVVLLDDVSDRVALDRAREELVFHEKLAALGTLVSGVAHELRTPMTYVTNSLHLARMRAQRSGATGVVEPIDEAIQGIARMSGIVEELRRFTRGVRAAATPAVLDDAVEEAVALFTATNRHRTIDVHIEPTPGVEVSDRTQVQQVVINLLQNAVEATGPGGQVRVALAPTSEGAEFSVADTGPGIPEDVQRRIFDPFYTTKSQGTGLGLAIVKRIVEEHGGRIRVESRLGRGTTFRVAFPRRRPLMPPSSLPSSPRPS